MAPLQVAVLWRLSLILFFTAFLFFLDVFSLRKTPCFQADRNSSNSSTTQECVFLSQGQTLYMIGLLLGSLIGGPVSDWYGKRAVLLVCVCVHAVCGVLPALLHHPLLFLAVRCLTGVSFCGINSCSFSLGVEWSLPRYRMWPPALLSFSFSVGMMVQAPLAYACPSWTTLHLAMGIPQVLCLPLYISLPESPRWLKLKGKTAILAQYSRNSPEDTHCLKQLLEPTESDQKVPGAEQSHAPCEIIHLRHPTILLRLAIMSYLGLTSALTYYGICLNIGSFGVDVYAAHFFSGLSEAPSLFIPLLLASWGRRALSMLSLLLSGSACFISLQVSKVYDEPVLIMALALFGKFCMLISVFLSLLYGIELFPTVVSPSAGIPFAAAMAVYSVGPIVGSALCLLLPETSGVPLPDWPEDCERQPRLRPPDSLLALWRRRQHRDAPAPESGNLSAEKNQTDTHTHNPSCTPNTHTLCTDNVVV